MTRRQTHRATLVALSLVMAGLGAAMIVESIVAQASPLSARLIIGIIFLGGGLGRAWLLLRRTRA